MLNFIKTNLVGTISAKKLKFWKKKFFEIFGPRGAPLGVPHISGPKPKFEKRLDSPKYFAQMGIHAKFEPIPTGSLFCEGYGFEKSPYRFLIRTFLYQV